jgi:hypothetical protein
MANRPRYWSAKFKTTHHNQLSSIDFTLASSLFVAALPSDQVTAKTLETERTGQDKNADSNTFSTAENSEEGTPDDDNASDEEYDPYQESQDWRAAFQH